VERRDGEGKSEEIREIGLAKERGQTIGIVGSCRNLNCELAKKPEVGGMSGGQARLFTRTFLELYN
jgi:hypothetical protein